MQDRDFCELAFASSLNKGATCKKKWDKREAVCMP